MCGCIKNSICIFNNPIKLSRMIVALLARLIHGMTLRDVNMSIFKADCQKWSDYSQLLCFFFSFWRVWLVFSVQEELVVVTLCQSFLSVSLFSHISPTLHIPSLSHTHSVTKENTTRVMYYYHHPSTEPHSLLFLPSICWTPIASVNSRAVGFSVFVETKQFKTFKKCKWVYNI